MDHLNFWILELALVWAFFWCRTGINRSRTAPAGDGELADDDDAGDLALFFVFVVYFGDLW